MPWPPQFDPALSTSTQQDANREIVQMHVTSIGPNHDYDADVYPVNVQYTCEKCHWVSDPMGAKSAEAAQGTINCPYCTPADLVNTDPNA